MKDLLVYLAKALVEQPDAVEVEQEQREDETIVYKLHVAENDMGRVIGKQGRIAKALRTTMKAAANRKGLRVEVEIV